MMNLYPGDYRTANSIDSHTTPMGNAAGMGGTIYLLPKKIFILFHIRITKFLLTCVYVSRGGRSASREYNKRRRYDSKQN